MVSVDLIKAFSIKCGDFVPHAMKSFDGIKVKKTKNVNGCVKHLR